MITVNMHEAKTNLSSLIKSLSAEERIIICNDGAPVAVITPYVQELKKRVPGGYEGKIVMGPNFEWTDEELREMFPYMYEAFESNETGKDPE